MDNLKIEYVDINTLKEYEKNAKLHPQEQIEQIKKSIQEFNMIDPIGVWKDNSIIEGNGRYKACMQLGIKEVPIIRLDHLTDEERKAYTLAHNKLTMNSDFDIDILKTELENLKELDFDLELTGFSKKELDKLFDEINESNPYTAKTEIPQYEIKGEMPEIYELIEEEKVNQLIEDIRKSNVGEKEKEFLIKSAYRHYGFNYSKIAEYYCHQNKEMQELMEKSALVIIDKNNAIAEGYAELKEEMEEMIEDEE